VKKMDYDNERKYYWMYRCIAGIYNRIVEVSKNDKKNKDKKTQDKENQDKKVKIRRIKIR
jgi:hypothetical protein